MDEVVGIVMPAHQAEAFLEQAVEGVRSQAYRAWQLVIVDDRSDDGTLDAARRLAHEDDRIRVAARASNGGPAQACNSGLDALDAHATLVTFLDADDFWEPTALESLVGALDADRDAVVAHGLARFVDAAGRPTGTADALSDRRRFQNGHFGGASAEEPTGFDMLAYAPVVRTGGTLLIRREALDRAGAFRPLFQPAEDWDLWVRLSRLGHFAVVDDIVLNYRLHPAQLIRRPEMTDATVRVEHEILESPENSDEQRSVAVRSARRRERRLAVTRLRWALDKLLRCTCWRR
jgi:glycosyltransferase involved in cell wall biosynthesis